MDGTPQKRYGKSARAMAKSRALAAQAADGVSQQSIRKKTSKTDEEFLDTLIHTLHGVFIGLGARDLSSIAKSEHFVEARSLSFKIHRMFVTAKGG